MPSVKLSALSAIAGAASVMAHGHVNFFTVGSEKFPGWDVTSDSYKTPAPEVYGWSATNTDNGFVAPDAYTSGDIICHRGAKNAALTAKVAAGSTLKVQWDTWPESHKGPVIDMLAPCGDDCATVDKATLEFFKIAEQGKIDDSKQNGYWASDKLIEDSNSWEITIPTDVAPGKYVLRHEIIALHSAGQANGAQNYPQCFNIEVTGSGTKKPAGTLGTKLYTPTDAGIEVSIYTTGLDYKIPGPVNEFASGSGSSPAPAPSASAPATSAAAPSATAPAATAPAATTTAAPAPTSAAAEPVESAPATSAAAPQPTKATCEEKRRRRLARRMARQHARDVVRRN
ncbi:Endoglucanase-4-like protein 1 [Colletotrichum musicola]|uniref:lytic cellulose monooxygenase (C4-dehydrogenating) n=1 Tax=Colletotrichum musicola TaxID=2175873 RepID=A0A8H6NGY0_9PEZI|nr:Endoglucanase-4-like protein 1 [Colletotrichum musicola]